MLCKVIIHFTRYKILIPGLREMSGREISGRGFSGIGSSSMLLSGLVVSLVSDIVQQYMHNDESHATK